MSLIDELINRKVLAITGKGGVGKSICSAALAQYAAKKGRRVCIIENTVNGQIAPIFGCAATIHSHTLLAENIDNINLNSNMNFRDFVVKHLGYEKLFDKIFNNNIIKSLIDMLPGVAELTLLGRVYYTSELSESKYDLVILDGYSSGHFLNLLTTPEAIMKSGLIGPVQKETQNLINFFQKPENCGIITVTTPEPLVISECLDFVPKFQNANFGKLAAIFVNRFIDRSSMNASDEDICRDRSELKAACEYARKRFSFQNHNLDLEINSLGIPMYYLPEWGAIDEPIAPHFASNFLTALRQPEKSYDNPI